jgi:hypothetical protein
MCHIRLVSYFPHKLYVSLYCLIASKRARAEKIEVEQPEIPEAEKISLSDSQMTVLEAILARKSVFFTGAAGGNF